MAVALVDVVDRRGVDDPAPPYAGNSSGPAAGAVA